MDLLLDLLKGAAPALATIVAGPMGGMAVRAIASKLGVEDTVEAVTQAIQDDPKAAQRLAEIDLEQFKLEVQDRDSARKAHAEIATSANSLVLEKLTMPLLALGTVGLAFVLIGILIFSNIPDSQENIVIFALGFITSAATQVLSFYFGSSQGSKDKSNQLNGLKK
jgi:hypothetical protein